MNPSDHDGQDIAESATDHMVHGLVDEAAGDEGIDDSQADDTEKSSSYTMLS